jgi:hypothetical protein
LPTRPCMDAKRARKCMLLRNTLPPASMQAGGLVRKHCLASGPCRADSIRSTTTTPTNGTCGRGRLHVQGVCMPSWKRQLHTCNRLRDVLSPTPEGTSMPSNEKLPSGHTASNASFTAVIFTGFFDPTITSLAGGADMWLTWPDIVLECSVGGRIPENRTDLTLTTDLVTPCTLAGA